MSNLLRQINGTVVQLDNIEVINSHVLSLFCLASPPDIPNQSGNLLACAGRLSGQTCTPVGGRVWRLLLNLRLLADQCVCMVCVALYRLASRCTRCRATTRATAACGLRRPYAGPTRAPQRHRSRSARQRAARASPAALSATPRATPGESVCVFVQLSG
jgi:hypothetical protein